MGRFENVMVFKDTERLCKTNAEFSEAVKKATASQKLILERDSLPAQKKDIYEDAANVTVSKKRSLEAAAGYKDCYVAVLNFASATNPGGGVVNGSSAQEESLCRCSCLYFCLNTPAMWDGFYNPHRAAHDPLHNDDLIYTPGVTVFKTDTAEPKLMREADRYSVDVITCAAPNLRSHPGNGYITGEGDANIKLSDKDLLELHEKRIRRILEAALSGGCDTIILGAFGCGAFKNDPEIVAQANRNVAGEYLHAFKNIEYAIYSSKSDERNYKAFDRVMGDKSGV